MITVSIIEDNVELAEGLKSLINHSEGFNCISNFTSCEEALKRIMIEKPDVLLMDIELAGKINGIEGTKLVKEIYPAVNVIMLTVHEDNDAVFASLKNGAVGYLVKNTSLGELIEGIKEVKNGGAPMSMTIARKVINSFKKQPCPEILTNREKEVLELLCQCKSYQAIANKLFIEKTTVKFHIKNIYSKLHVCNKSELLLQAKEKNLF